MTLWRGMDRPALDRAYNNREAVPGSAEITAGWRAKSAAFRASHPEHLDLAYGPAERHRIDFFSAGAGEARPTLAFIHGGYWQMNAKEGFAWVAEGPLARGMNVALIGYTIAPEARMDAIVAEIPKAMRFLASELPRLGGDPGRLYASGWSAGGHLTAIAMEEPVVAGGLAISGIYDLEPIRLNYLNEKLGLDEAEARRNSPLHRLPRRAGPLIVTVGGAELPELQRQSAEYWQAWSAAGLPGRFEAQPGLDHFTVLEEFATPDGRLTRMALELDGMAREMRR